MLNQKFPSKVFQQAVEQLMTLPGLGKKTAIRLALHLLKRSDLKLQYFGQSFIDLALQIQYCQECFNIADSSCCEICQQSDRNRNIVCVVEDVRDVMAIENTLQYKGLYHVLGGLISPMQGVGPQDLNIESLLHRLQQNNISELLLALSTTLEGETTNFYLYRRLKDFNLQITTIARGVGSGDAIEYIDEITLGKSIANRVLFESTLKR